MVPQFPKTPQIPTESKLQGSATLPGKENLDTLSIEMLSKYIHDKVLPALVHSTFNEPVEEDEEQSAIVTLA